jgi:hypothetical protein
MPGVAFKQAVKLTLLALLLCVPLLGIVRAQNALAQHVTRGAVAALLSLTAPLTPAPSQPATREDAEAAPLELAATVDAPLAAGKAGAGRAAHPALGTKPKALFVSAQSVLRLSKSAAQPSGTFIARTEQHPAGIRLAGVAALGIGVQDGDILVDAMGIPARARGEIIGAIIEARARRVKALSGTLWRAGQTFTITVEQPYLDPA